VALVDQSVQELPATDRPVALGRIGLGREMRRKSVTAYTERSGERLVSAA
jgi:hypothetical protein